MIINGLFASGMPPSANVGVCQGLSRFQGSAGGAGPAQGLTPLQCHLMVQAVGNRSSALPWPFLGSPENWAPGDRHNRAGQQAQPCPSPRAGVGTHWRDGTSSSPLWGAGVRVQLMLCSLWHGTVFSITSKPMLPEQYNAVSDGTQICPAPALGDLKVPSLQGFCHATGSGVGSREQLGCFRAEAFVPFCAAPFPF